MTPARRVGRTRVGHRRERAGLTLLELTIVLAIGAVAALLVLPQWTRDDAREPSAHEVLATVLDDARRQAIRARQLVTVRLAGDAARVTIDTAGAHGRGTWRAFALSRELQGALEPADQRVVITIRPTGAVVGAPVTLRTAAGLVRLPADPWAVEVRRAP